MISFRVEYAPQKVLHPRLIPFNKKVTDLEPDISPTYGKFCSKDDSLWRGREGGREGEREGGREGEGGREKREREREVGGRGRGSQLSHDNYTI